jgi:hypothetical protein
MYIKGMDYLVRTQSADGGWADASGGPAAICGLAVVSLLAHGDDPNYGPYTVTIHRGLDYLLKHQDQKTGYIGPSMYNHGFGAGLAEGRPADPDFPGGKRLQGLALFARIARRRHHGQRR